MWPLQYLQLKSRGQVINADYINTFPSKKKNKTTDVARQQVNDAAQP